MKLEVTEYERRAGVGLTDSEARALQRTRALTVTPDTSTVGAWEVRASQYVGIVSIDGVEVRIAPKVPVDRLLFLLTFSRDERAWDAISADLTEADDLLSSVAFAFAHHAEIALAPGVLQGYVTVDAALPSVRGRIREADQMRRRYGLGVPVEVTFDDFTVDIPENRWVRAAARRLLRLHDVKPSVARRLRHLLHRLNDVNDLTREDLAQDVHFTRLNERYRPAVRLSQLIVESGSLEFDLGTVQATTFLFDMNRIFEEFVTATLARALEALAGRVAAQERHLLDVEGDVEIRPDIVWRVASRYAAVIDVKYKAAALAEVPNADVYQALAYSLALDVRPAYLIYAAGNEPPVSRTIRHSDLTVITETLDLKLAPSDLLDAVDILARRIAVAASVQLPERVLA